LIDENKAHPEEEAIVAAPIQVLHHRVLVHQAVAQDLILVQRGNMIDLVISEIRRRKFSFLSAY
jgi:hypothetical protein